MRALFRRWFPARPLRGVDEQKLAEFYNSRVDYHEMTADPKKEEHGNVRLLECLLNRGDRYLEVGCGGGRISALVARKASVVALDFSQIALTKAKERQCGDDVEYVQGSAEELPFEDSTFDGAYSFEVLEHLWDPFAAAAEMIRVVKPGGFILISTPNRFSLDLHLRKNAAARVSDYAFAFMRYVVDGFSGKPFVSFRPDLASKVYPDCDAVTSIVPRNFLRGLEARGARVVFWDSIYLCALRLGESCSLAFQKSMSSGFRKHFGDHYLILFRKGEG